MVKGFPSSDELSDWLHNTTGTIYFLFPSGYKQESTQIALRARVQAVLEKVEVDTGMPVQQSLSRVNTLVLSQSDYGTELDDFAFVQAYEATLKTITPNQPSGRAKKHIPTFG